MTRPKAHVAWLDMNGPHELPRDDFADLTAGDLPNPLFGDADFCVILDDDLTIRGCNRAFADWLGRPDVEALRGVSLADTLDPASQPKLDSIRRRILPGVPLTVELNHRTQAGTPILARYHLLAPGTLGRGQRQLIALGSDRQRSMGLFEELIDLKRERESQLSRARELNQQLARKNADLSAVTHMINHDLSNALNSVSLIASLMARRASSPPEVLKEATSEILGLCAHMAGVLRGFTALADVGHTALRAEPVDLIAVAEAMVELVAARHPEVAHRVTLDLAARHVWADSDHIRQIFENLLSNAFKYRDESKPELDLRISSHRELGKVVVLLADNGLGIPDDQQAKVFDLFGRAHLHVGEGLGVGLSIVKRLIEVNAGAICLESRLGRGSTFRLTFPACPSEPGPL
jgi:signal transduction histidine kinase